MDLGIQAKSNMIKVIFFDCYGVLYNGQLNDQLLEYILKLKKKYRIGLLSNLSRESLNKILIQPDQSKYFDYVVISGEVGALKPSQEIFKFACVKAGIAPEQAVLVDDSAANCAGAKKAGMQTILFVNNNQVLDEINITLSK